MQKQYTSPVSGEKAPILSTDRRSPGAALFHMLRLALGDRRVANVNAPDGSRILLIIETSDPDTMDWLRRWLDEDPSTGEPDVIE